MQRWQWGSSAAVVGSAAAASAAGGQRQRGWQAMKRARARVARAMATMMRVAGNKEGHGKGGKTDGDGNKGRGQ